MRKYFLVFREDASPRSGSPNNSSMTRRALALMEFHSCVDMLRPSVDRMAFLIVGRDGLVGEATTVLSAFASSKVHRMSMGYSAGLIAGWRKTC